MRKRILASILTVVMILSLLPTTVFAAQTDSTSVQGTGTKNDPWDISADGSHVTAYLTDNSEIEATYGDTITLPVSTTGYTLHIEGTGDMKDYAASNANGGEYAPWDNYNASITSVVIGKDITHIGKFAFYRNQNSDADGAGTYAKLSSLTFESESSCKTIGLYAFYKTGLTSLTLPNSVKEVGSQAFGTCKSLTSLDLGSVQTIGDKAFSNLTSLKSLSVPASVTSLGTCVFGSTGGPTYAPALESITFAASVSSIPKETFKYCTSLTSVSINGNGNYTKIEEGAFQNCTALTSITLPDSVRNIEKSAFAGCSSLTSIDLPNAVTTIGESAFSGCSTLNTVNFGNSVQSIGKMAFNSSGLTKISLPASVTNIGERAFAGQSGSNKSNLAVIDLTKIQGNITVVEGAFYNISDKAVVYVSNNTTESSIKRTVVSEQVIGSIDGKTALANTNFGTFADRADFESGKLAEPTREGFTFDGWYDNQDCTGEDVSSSPVAKTYYAKWTADTADDQDTEATSVEDEMTAVSEEIAAEDPEITPEEAPAEVQEDMTSEPALADADNEETENTEPAEVPEQPIESDPADITEKEPAEDTTVPEEENGAEVSTEEPVNSVEGNTVTLQTALTFNDPAETTYYFYADGKELGHTTGTSLQYDTTQKGLAIGENEVQVYQGDKDNGGTSVGTIKVTLNQKALTVSGLKAVDRTANGSADVTLTGGSLVGVENGDTVGFTASGTMSNNAAGDNKPVTVAVKLTGTDAKWYTVTPPTNVTVNISSSSGSHSSGSSGGSGSSTTYPVNVESAKNGAVKSDRTSASKGATVTLTVTPKDGYELDGLTVTDKNGKNIKVTEGKNGKYTFTMPASKVTVESTFTKIEEQSGVTFRDVPASAYYYDAVEWAVEKGVTSGTSATTFSPDAACTRAQAVTFLWRAAGSPAPKNSVNPFTDVLPGAYYYDAVLWAVEQGITTGTSATTFSPDATCTRSQIVTFLYRADGTAATGSNPFADVAASAYYYDAVLWAVAEGVTSGTSATTFSPDASCTRAQIVTFLYRTEA